MVFVDWLNCCAFVASYAVNGLFAMEQWLPGGNSTRVSDAERPGFQWMQGGPALMSVRV